MEMKGENTITVEAIVQLPKDNVWYYYTTPEHIMQWNFANDDWQCPRASNDLRVGGKYSARMEAKDGSFGFDFEATYDVVDEGDKFIYTMSDGRKVITIFKAVGDGTVVEITFNPEAENSIDMQREGWQAILNNFKKYSETKK